MCICLLHTSIYSTYYMYQGSNHGVAIFKSDSLGVYNYYGQIPSWEIYLCNIYRGIRDTTPSWPCTKK